MIENSDKDQNYQCWKKEEENDDYQSKGGQERRLLGTFGASFFH